ncbi:MAG: hypothetical protein ACRD7E_28120, partial [Bryobacteraceae bacterium]
GCNRAPQTKEAVREGVIEHLSKNSGLDLSSMNIEVTSLSFRENEAQATVSFKPRSSPDQGMQMSYTLEREGNRWMVKKRADSGGDPHGGAAPSGDLPSGHPPVKPSEPGK